MISSYADRCIDYVGPSVTATLQPSRRRLIGSNKTEKRRNRQKFLADKNIMKNNLVTNLSDFSLTLAQIKILNKGLGFVPNFSKPNINDIDKDVKRFERKLQLHYFFRKKASEDFDDTEPFDNLRTPPVLEKNSDWWPKKLNGHITEFCHQLKHTLHSALKNTCHPNLTPKEIAALKALRSHQQIIIKKCDKGGGIAVMNKSDYENKIYAMINDPNTYTETNVDDSTDTKLKADLLIQDLENQGLINKKKSIYLTNFEPKCPIFYGVPKIHKQNWPLRPIVSQIDGPTSRLNELVDKYLYIAEKSIPCLLQDTTAYLQLLAKNKHCDPGTFLVTMDIVSLYTNIPQEEGAEWVSDFYEKTLDEWREYANIIQPVDKQTLKELILFILHHCTFEFNNTFYKQNYGTTMGAKFSVKFANIYMHMFFDKHLPLFHGKKPEFIGRLIDDCFFKWNHSESELLEFFSFLNNCHRSIKFEFKYSHDNVTFLDTTTYIENGSIKTTIFTKPTDVKQYLHYRSSHPHHVKKAIPYSQAIRYRRIIEDDHILVSQMEDLKLKFINRGYPVQLLNDQLHRVFSLDRQATLSYKSASQKQADMKKFLKGNSFLPLIITYHDSLRASNFRFTVSNKWNEFINSHTEIAKVFENEFPQIVFKRGKTLGNVLVKSKFQTAFDEIDRNNIEILASLLESNYQNPPSVTKCNVHKCKCCQHITCTSFFHDTDNKRQFPITENFNCSTKNVIYLITCTKCHLMYVGQTSRMLKERLNNHRSDIKLHKNTAVAKHFHLPQHNDKHLSIIPIHNIDNLNTTDRLHIEKQYMKTLNTIYPKGLNFYPLL